MSTLPLPRPIPFLALIVAILSQACLDETPATLPEDADSAEDASLPYDLGESRLMMGLARKIPGFGGFYYRGSNRIVIAMAKGTSAGFPAAREAVSAALTVPVTGDAPLVFVEEVVEFSFIDLARHRARIRAPLFDIPGVESLSVDQTTNRIKIGLSDPSARAAVLNLANDIEVPVEMLSFSKAGIVRYLIGPPKELPTPIQGQPPTLADVASVPDSSVRGGYRVSIHPVADLTWCTAGFIAIPAGQQMFGFVSASHCSAEQFNLDTVPWGQPSADLGLYIGTEAIDPQDNDPPRHADVTFVGFDTIADARYGGLGELARPSDRVTGSGRPGPITIDLAHPTILIVQKMMVLPTGATVDKIGSTSGWTYGEVLDECEDTDLLGECLQSARLYSDGGDSGGPVFYYESLGDGGRGAAHLVGTIVGGEYVDGQFTGKAFFSNMEGIEHDLGTLEVVCTAAKVTCPEGQLP